MTKLYKATLTLDVDIFIAGPEQPTHADVLEAGHDEVRENWSPFGPNSGYATTAVQVTKLDQLHPDWRGAQPLGDNPEGKTCLQILDDYTPEVEPLGEQQDLLPQRLKENTEEP